MVTTLVKAVLICGLISLISATDYPCHKPTPTTKAPTTTPAPTTKPPPTCGPNQKYTDCDNNPCRDTCDKPNLSKVCKFAPGKYPGCICVDGYVRDNDGSCLKREICDITCSDPNAEVRDFPNICPDGGTCFNPAPGLCRIAFPRKGCHCKDGYVKDKDGKCILLARCPPRCGENEEYQPSGPAEKTCENGLTEAAKDCRCKAGFVRHFGKCIKSTDCPKCKPNELYKYCGSACPASCKNKEGEKACGTRCTENCVAGCFCSSGLVRGDAGDCIKLSDCHSCPYSKRGVLPSPTPTPAPTPAPTKCSKTAPPKPACGPNEFYSDRAPVFPRACDNLKKVLCKSVKPGCSCLPGYIRKSSAKGAKCIKPCDCPPCTK